MNKALEILSNVFLKGKIYIPKKVISTIAYVIIPVILAILVLIPRIGRELNESFGTWAEWLLIGILFAKPLSILLKHIGLLRTIVGYRRQLGITVFYLSLAHFLTYEGVYATDPWTALTSALQSIGSLWYGALAFMVMAVLYITSNTISMKYLKKWWKRIQRIAYVALILVLIHSGLMEGEGYTKAIVIGSLFFALKVIAWFVVRQRKQQRAAAKAAKQQEQASE